MLPNKPKDPSEISFARDCFVEDGERIEWVAVCLAHLCPRIFRTQAEANADWQLDAIKKAEEVLWRNQNPGTGDGSFNEERWTLCREMLCSLRETIMSAERLNMVL